MRTTRSASKNKHPRSSSSSSSSSSDCSDSEALDRLSISSSTSLEDLSTPVVATHAKEIPKIATKNDFSVLNEPWTIGNFYKKLDWVHVLGLVFMPIYGFYMAFTSIALQQKTAVFAVAYYFFTGLGITAGKVDSRGHFATSFYFNFV
ncbi:hypothetical protein BGX28_000061 [Mortierella sp. GBA30]|nr:hypothetical protein BGX28_000061 [Mortierella sp. GBA30]